MNDPTDIPPAPSPTLAPPEDFFDRFDDVPSEETHVRPLRVVKDGEAAEDLGVTAIAMGPDVHRITDETIAALREDPELYERGGMLCHFIRHDKEPDEKAKEKITPGSPIIREAPLAWLVNRASRVAHYTRRIKTEEGFTTIRCAPPKEIIRGVLDNGKWPGIRKVRGIIEAPALRPDGTVIQEAGFDQATGYIYEPNADFPPIPEAPTQGECVLAFSRLIEPFSQFPYVSPAHLSAVVAAILTLLARPAIAGSVPVWLFDASAPRSGKSLQVDAIHIIATGRAASRMTYPEADDELEKVLSGYAMRGSPTINFDNVARKFGGAALDKVATAVDLVDLRVLGSSAMRSFEWRTVIFASGNNVECRGDMLPRVLCPRLESPLENPEARSDLAHADLRAYVREKRVELVVAALTILRGYIAAGSPLQESVPRWGGFDAWARLIPHALVWLGAHDPMAARRGLAGDEDPERVAIGALISGLSRVVRELGREQTGLTLKEIVTHLYPADRHERAPDGHDELREAIDGLTDTKPNCAPSTERLGKVLRRIKARPIAGHRIATAGSSSGKVMRWTVTKA